MNKNNAKVFPAQLELHFTDPKQHGASSAQVPADTKTLHAPASWPMLPPPHTHQTGPSSQAEMNLPPFAVPTAPVLTSTLTEAHEALTAKNKELTNMTSPQTQSGCLGRMLCLSKGASSWFISG